MGVLLTRHTKEANLQARQMFEKAVELDPAYAEAYVGLSWTYYARVDFSMESSPPDAGAGFGAGCKRPELWMIPCAQAHLLLGRLSVEKTA